MTSSGYFLTTPRLGFRHWSPDDLPLANALWGDGEVTALIGGPFDAQSIKERLRKEIACQAEYQVQYWPIFLLTTAEHAGCAGLRPYRIEKKIYELGFHLRTEYWGRGLAEEAGRALIAFAFESLGAAALFAGHHPANAASRRVLQRLAFEFTHAEVYAPTGCLHQSYRLDRPHHLSM